MKLILSKFYKIFFITLLIASGFLFLGKVNNAAAYECTPACVSTEVCNTTTGVCEPPCGGSCPTGQVCDAGTNTCVGASGPAVTMPNPSNITSVQDLFAKIVAFITPLALLFAGVMIIWSGFLFVTAQGDPTAITKAKQNFIWTVTGVAIVLASTSIVDYVSSLIGGTSPGSGEALRLRIENALKNQIIPLMFILVTIYFFWGIITYVRAGGDQSAIDKGKQHMIWGIIGMAVMASAWGIVALISSMVG